MLYCQVTLNHPLNHLTLPPPYPARLFPADMPPSPPRVTTKSQSPTMYPRTTRPDFPAACPASEGPSMLPIPRVLRTATRISPALSAHGPGRPAPVHRTPAKPPRQKMPSGGERAGVKREHTRSSGPSSSSLVEPASIVHALLESSSRPPFEPRAVLSLFRERPHLLSQPAVSALDAFAQRMGDTRVRRELRALLKSERVRVRLAPVQREEKQWSLRDTSKRPQWETGQYTFDRWVPYHDSGVVPNKALYKRHPPLAELSEVVGVSDFLRHQHYLHLVGEAYPLSTAIGTVESLGGGGTEVLNLALAYTKSHPFDILDDPAVKHILRNRNTLHLAVLALLRLHHIPQAEAEETAEEAAQETAQKTASQSATPPATQADIQSVIARVPGRTPGTETWRHIALHALEHDMEAAAQWAFIKAKAELHREDTQVQRERAPRKTSVPSRPDRRYALPPPTPSTDTPVIRFAHVGRHATRWERVMHAMRARGWAARTADGKLAIDKWVWRT